MWSRQSPHRLLNILELNCWLNVNNIPNKCSVLLCWLSKFVIQKRVSGGQGNTSTGPLKCHPLLYFTVFIYLGFVWIGYYFLYWRHYVILSLYNYMLCCHQLAYFFLKYNPTLAILFIFIFYIIHYVHVSSSLLFVLWIKYLIAFTIHVMPNFFFHCIIMTIYLH